MDSVSCDSLSFLNVTTCSHASSVMAMPFRIHLGRNFLKAEEADTSVLSEYSSFPQVTRARAHFFQRQRRLMLYTERAHFYHRYRIRGIQVGLCVCVCVCVWQGGEG
jgi:hypothetical protein